MTILPEWLLYEHEQSALIYESLSETYNTRFTPPDVTFENESLIALIDDQGLPLPEAQNGLDINDDSQAAVMSAIHDMAGYFVMLIKNAVKRLELNKDTHIIVALIPATSYGNIVIDGYHIQYNFRLAAKAAYRK